MHILSSILLIIFGNNEFFVIESQGVELRSSFNAIKDMVLGDKGKFQQVLMKYLILFLLQNQLKKEQGLGLVFAIQL